MVSKIPCIIFFELSYHLIIILFDRAYEISSTDDCLFKIIVSFHNTILKLKPFRISMIYIHLSKSIEYFLSFKFFTQGNLFKISKVIIDMLIFVTILSCFCQIISLHFLQWLAKSIEKVISPVLCQLSWGLSNHLIFIHRVKSSKVLLLVII